MKATFVSLYKSIKFEYKITIAYLIFGLLWILFSDMLLEATITNSEMLNHFQTYKGSFYIVITALLLFFMVKEHLRRLQEQQILFETMFNTINDSVIIANPDREILMVNKGMLETFAYSAEELIGKKTEMLYEDKSKYNEYGNVVFNKISQNTQTSYTTNYKDRNNKLFPGESFSAKLFDSKGIWIGNLAIIRDISEHHKTQTELHESRIKLEAALESMTDAVFISDDKGNLVDFNESFATFHKFKSKEACFKRLDDYPEILEIYLPDGQIARLDQLAVPRALNGETAANNEYMLKRKDTGETWVGSYGFAPIRNKSGIIVGSVVVARDVTQNKLAKDELLKAKDKAEESDRLKTIFLQNISHEIRTPMNAIIGFSELLADAELERKKQQQYIDIIVNSGNQLLSIVNDILTISILETGQANISLKKININALLNELLTVFSKTAADKEITLTLDGDTSGDFYINTDETKIRQVLSNLLSNAFKFTAKGEVTFGYAINENFMEFWVRDTGIGIKPELHEKIFNRFHQADQINEHYGGTGLGLAISKEFVELLGGSIRLESEAGNGSTFYFTLPYSN
jgi:PAS domain S-box-containing protein